MDKYINFEFTFSSLMYLIMLFSDRILLFLLYHSPQVFSSYFARVFGTKRVAPTTMGTTSNLYKRFNSAAKGKGSYYL